MEDHSYVGTKAERSTHENSWKIVLNSSGPTGPVDERDDDEEAKRTVRLQHGEAHQNNGGKLGVVMLGRTSDFFLF